VILRKKNARRPWEPEEEKQLREMAEAGKTITIMALKLKRTVTDRPKNAPSADAG
jgi:hypothetical protein